MKKSEGDACSEMDLEAHVDDLIAVHCLERLQASQAAAKVIRVACAVDAESEVLVTNLLAEREFLFLVQITSNGLCKYVIRRRVASMCMAAAIGQAQAILLTDNTSLADSALACGTAKLELRAGPECIILLLQVVDKLRAESGDDPSAGRSKKGNECASRAQLGTSMSKKLVCNPHTCIAVNCSRSRRCIQLQFDGLRVCGDNFFICGGAECEEG